MASVKDTDGPLSKINQEEVGSAESEATPTTSTFHPPGAELPNFQVSNLFSSPRTNTGGTSIDGPAPAVRRSAGGWRSQWTSSSAKTASSSGSADGHSSSRRGSAWNGAEDTANRRRSSLTIIDTNQDSQTLWDQNAASSVTTPPGAINELPSFPVGSSPYLATSSASDIPWARATKKAGDYDWANFVYAYARGRWDPVRSPHPPGQSSIMPGAKTQIGMESEMSGQGKNSSDVPPDTITARRPSLTYITLQPLSNAEGHQSLGSAAAASMDPYRITHARTPPPVPSLSDSKISTSQQSERSRTAMPSEDDHHAAQAGGESLLQFTDPFSIFQLASNSAPNVAQSIALGKKAEKLMEEENRSALMQGTSKTDSQVVTRASLSRQGSDKDNADKLPDDSVWNAKNSAVQSDRHTGLLPFVSPSKATSTLKRPGLESMMSEVVLGSARESGSGSAAKEPQITLGSMLDTRRDSLQRPRPTPVQFAGPSALPQEVDDWRLATWSSAPEANSGGTSFITSSSSSTVNDDSGTVAGLRRAARRTSIKWSEGAARDMRRESGQPANHSKSFPLEKAASAGPARKPSLPSLNDLRVEDQQQEQNGSNPTSESVAKGKGFANSDLTLEGEAVVAGSKPSLPLEKRPQLTSSGRSKSSSSMSTYLNVGKSVEQFYSDHGYLPAIIPPDEMNRRQALRRYGPPRIHGDTNFDRIAHLVKLVFNSKLVLISLVGEKTQFFQSEVGAAASGFASEWLQEVAQSRDCSLCSHAILQQTDEALVILDAERDWRFAGNPLVKSAPHIRFYAGSPLRTADGYNLGSLCIIDDRPWPEFTPRQRHTLKEFARVVMREMELSRDTIHLRIRDRMQHSIETFTRECLEMETAESDEDEAEGPGLSKLYEFAARGMREALSASGAIIFDLSHFELVVSASDSHDADGSSKIFFPSPYQFPEVTPFANFDSPGVLESVNAKTDASGTTLQGDAKLEEKSVPPMAVLGASELHTAPDDRDRPVPLAHYLKVAEFLRKYRTGHFFPFMPAPFRHLLPAGMSNMLLVPIFGLNKQPFALLCAYSKPNEDSTTFEDIQEPGLQYLRAMGTIILSAILKKDIMLADKAKSHFISNISHELRTPLHGILAAAELLAETKLNATQGSYLETVEACGKSLLELVNHVLDFTKLSGNTRGNKAQAKPSLRCDLIKLVQEVCESSWIGQMAKKLESQQNDGIGSAYANGSEGSSPTDGSDKSSLQQEKQKILAQASHVETVIDVSFRQSGWLVKCDAGGIRRVLMNLIGNSLKFTTAGFVHVSVREVQSTETHVVVELGVTDTGKGISRTFLEEQLFHPFTQENHLGPGTGLGLSIVNSIVQSPAINGKIDVWSTLGQGTEIRVTCELELCQIEDGDVTSYKPTLNVNRTRSVSLLGFQENLRGQSDLKEVLRTYFEDWWKFNIADDANGDVILVNDSVDFFDDVISERRAKGKPLPPFIVLTGARGDAKIAGACDDYQHQGGVARLLFKPAGPARLESVTLFCLQSLTQAREGKALGLIHGEHTPLASPGLEGERESFSVSSGEVVAEDDRTPIREDAITPRGHTAPDGTRAHTMHRPLLNDDLRRNSHHISPGPPSASEAASLLRRHSSEDRVTKGSGPESPQLRQDGRYLQKRPMLPTRSITFHEPRLQRKALMSPLRSPLSNRKNGGEEDYFGAAAHNGASSSSSTYSSSSHAHTSSSSGPVAEMSSPSSPGSVISLEGGEGAVLKTAIHNAGLLRGGPNKKRLRVLSVEDNSINRKVLAAFFNKMDVDFVEASNGLEGVQAFESHPPNHFDVIFMDLSMPVLDGLGAMTQIRKIEAERFRSEQGNFSNPQQYQSWTAATKTTLVLSTPGGTRPSAQVRAKVFVLTGRSSDEDKRRAFTTGADGFIVKPLSFKVLSSLINRISALK